MYNQECYTNRQYFKEFIELPKNSRILKEEHPESPFILAEPDGTRIGMFYLNQQHACCGSLFLSDVRVTGEHNEGIGTLLTKLAIRMAEIGSYSSLSCIIPSKSCRDYENINWKHMRKIVKKLGFEELEDARVINCRTGATLNFYQLKLKSPWFGINYRSFPKPNESAFFKALEKEVA